MDAPTAAVLIIGDEILSGRTVDSNGSVIAAWLVDHGVDLVEIRVVPDDHDTIVSAVRELKTRARYLFTTGGIGPTHDDITADAVAAAVGRPLIYHPDAFSALERHYGKDDFTEARKRMARVPEGARLIENALTIAPGFEIENIFVMAGVPKIMAAMLHTLDDRIEGGVRMLSETLTLRVAESKVAYELGDFQKQFQTVSIGSYPYFDFEARTGGVRIVCRSRDSGALDACVGALRAWIADQDIPHEL